MRRMVFVVCLLSLSSIVRADCLPIGTWVQRDPTQAGHLAMTVEAVGSGRKLTYRIVGQDAPGDFVMTILTQLDGKDVPVLVNGKPTGQTMGILMIDSRHTSAVSKLQGKVTHTSKSEVSPDGKVLKVETTTTAEANGKGETSVQYWDKRSRPSSQSGRSGLKECFYKPDLQAKSIAMGTINSLRKCTH
jgi:hypothetical protein